uniref:Perilipin 3 n=1 Tax=Bos taurus TaxID=9913 RepID=A0AAA9SVR1_BOVIN
MSADETEATASTQVTAEEPVQQPSVVDRVAGMPLISSTCNMVTAAYTSTKESYPHVKTVCDAAEKGVKTLTAAAVSGAQPILSKLEPQLTSASEYAHRGLDKLEENLPILQQPPEKVLADTKELVSSKVSGARQAVSSTVSSAKDTVASRVTEAVDVTRGAVQSGVDLTKSMVTSGVHSVVGSRVGQMVLSGVDTVLGKSEEWVDNHLPMTDAELARLATSLEGFDIASVAQQRQEQSYFVRLGSLSERLRQRAYEHSLGKLQNTRQRAQEALHQLSQTLILMETIKQGVDQKLVEGQEKLHQMWLGWNQKRLQGPEENAAKPEDLMTTPPGCLPGFLLLESYTMWPSVSGFKVHPRGSKCQGCTPSYGARTWRRANEPHFVSPFASRWAFGLFPLSAAVNNTPLSICVPVLAQTCVFFSLGRKSRGWNC